MSKTKVALIYGGISPEHSVSCLTAASVLAAIDKQRFEVVCIGISKTGRWSLVPNHVVEQYRIIDGQAPIVAEPDNEAVWMATEGRSQIATRAGEQLVDIRELDVVFTLLHGPFGEDGTIQGQLEMMGVRYVGCGVTSSAIAMDKQFMRMGFEAAGLPVGPYQVVTDLQWRFHREAALSAVRQLRLPLYIKPCRGGSSLGISRVTDFADLEEAIEEARKFDPKVIIEEGIDAREIECAVLGDPNHPEGCHASVLGEIRVLTTDKFYDYESKYFSPDAAALDIPAELSAEVAEELRSLAQRAFLALDCEGLSRVDFFLTPEGKIYINEINTMPGFTEISMFPSLWQASGVSYSDLITQLLDLALLRQVGLR